MSIQSERREFYVSTSYDQWRRSNGQYMSIEKMAKFHLIKAAQKLVRCKLTDLEVYRGICDKLKDNRKEGETFEFELGGAL